LARLLEHQGKELLKSCGVKVPRGAPASTPGEARRIAEELGKPVAVKAQALVTGRMKAGGILFANTPEEAEAAASKLLGSEVRGFRVEKVLVEEKIDVLKEYYISITVDDSHRVRGPVLVFSPEGGIDIEEVARRQPEKVAKIPIDLAVGLRPYHARKAVKLTGTPEEDVKELYGVASKLYEAFRRYDARLVEVNPLAKCSSGLVALDCRMSIDDASAYRHPELGIDFAREMDRPPTRLEKAAWRVEESDYRGVFFFIEMPKKEGEHYIGFHGIGGGGAMIGLDALVRHGLKVANYADTSGNPTASKVYRCAKIILSQPGIVGYFLAGCVIASQEQWHHAHGLVKAFRELLRDKPGFPVVIVLAGNKEEEALKILEEGLRDLPIRLELYGRDYVYEVDYLAERMRKLVEEYVGGGGGA